MLKDVDDDKYARKGRPLSSSMLIKPHQDVANLMRFRLPVIVLLVLIAGLMLITQNTLPPPSNNYAGSNTGFVGADMERMNAVKESFKHAYESYERFAFGYDKLKPLSGTHGDEWFGMATTLIDALDTAHIMQLPDIVARGHQFVQNELAFNKTDGLSNTFEVTIRILASLLTMHSLTDDKLYLDKAEELVDLMLYGRTKSSRGVFDSQQSQMPLTSFNFARGTAVADPVASLAEATTIQLEWRQLSYLTGNPVYWQLTEQVMSKVFGNKQGVVDGLLPIYISMSDGEFGSREIRLGSRADSYYEYLAKMYLQTGRTQQIYADKFVQALDGIIKHLRGVTGPSDFVFVGELPLGGAGAMHPKMDHLVCYLPGTIILHLSGGLLLDMTQLNARHRRYYKFAVDLMETCVHMYTDMPSGISPEIVYFNQQNDSSLSALGRGDIIVKDADAHNILRPETVESLFYFWRATHQQKYRDQAWQIYEAFERHARVNMTDIRGGYASLLDVRQVPAQQQDNMESFFLSETLKYLYLIYCDDTVVPLDKFVFNTEAHPLPIMQPENIQQLFKGQKFQPLT